MNEWISVKDKLPKVDEYVLWYYECGGIVYNCLDKDYDETTINWFLLGTKDTGEITHWRKEEGPK